MTHVALVAGGSVVVAATLLAGWRPIAALVLWVSLLPIQLETVAALGFRFAPADLLLIGLVLGISLRKLTSGHLRLTATRPLALSLVLLGVFVLTLPQTFASLGYLPQTVILNKILGLGLLIASYWTTLETLRTASEAKRLLRWYCLAGSIWNLIGLAGYATWQWAGITTPLIFGGGRLRGLLVDPNAYGGFIVSVLLLQIAFVASAARSRRTSPQVLNVGLLFLGVFLTYSRSAWLALAAGIGALFLILRHGERRGLARTALLLAAELAVLLLVTRDQAVAQATREVASRVEVVKQAVQSLSHSPLSGIGLGVFSTLPASHGLIVHSTYFWLLAEAGAVGLFLFLWLVLSVRRQFVMIERMADSEVHAYAVALFATLAAWLGLMIGVEGLYQRHYWFLCGVLGALYLAMKRGAVHQEEEAEVPGWGSAT